MAKVYLTETQLQAVLDHLVQVINNLDEATVSAEGFEGGVPMFSYRLSRQGQQVQSQPCGGEYLTNQLAAALKNLLGVQAPNVIALMIDQRLGSDP